MFPHSNGVFRVAANTATRTTLRTCSNINEVWASANNSSVHKTVVSALPLVFTLTGVMLSTATGTCLIENGLTSRRDLALQELCNPRAGARSICAHALNLFDLGAIVQVLP